MEGRFGGGRSLDASSVVAGRSGYHFVYDTTIRAQSKQIFALIHEMLVVERLRQLDDDKQRANTSVPGNLGNFIDAYLQWLRGRD
jgi:hypothetical protein